MSRFSSSVESALSTASDLSLLAEARDSQSGHGASPIDPDGMRRVVVGGVDVSRLPQMTPTRIGRTDIYQPVIIDATVTDGEYPNDVTTGIEIVHGTDGRFAGITFRRGDDLIHVIRDGNTYELADRSERGYYDQSAETNSSARKKMATKAIRSIVEELRTRAELDQPKTTTALRALRRIMEIRRSNRRELLPSRLSRLALRSYLLHLTPSVTPPRTARRTSREQHYSDRTATARMAAIARRQASNRRHMRRAGWQFPGDEPTTR